MFEQLIFIDIELSDLQALSEGVGNVCEMVVIQAHEDGIKKMADVLGRGGYAGPTT